MADSKLKNRKLSSKRQRKKSIKDYENEFETSNDELLGDEDLKDVEPEEILRRILIKKEIIATVRSKPWPMKKKIRVLKSARAFVEKYEGNLSNGKSYSAAGKEAWKKATRFFKDVCSILTPWDHRIKTVESYFGSSVASYFTFLRWLVYINVVMGILSIAFVVLPEALIGTDADYKKVPKNKLHKAMDLETLWALGGYLEYSVLFYGFYTSDRIIGNGYRLPLAYFLVGIATFAYSFIALLRKMAKNSRSSVTADSADDYTFSWKLFCSWDYMIGNSETAENKSAAIATAIRESIVEEQEKEKEMDNGKKLLIFLRILANILVMLLLAGSLYSIQYSVTRSQAQIHDDREKSFWEQNEVGVVVTLVTMITPSLFEVIGTMEKYHPRNTLRLQLGRILMLYLGNLYSLMIGLLNYVTEATERKGHLNATTAGLKNGIIFANISLKVPTLANSTKLDFSPPFSDILSLIEEKEEKYRMMIEERRRSEMTVSPPMQTITKEVADAFSTVTTLLKNKENQDGRESECWETFVGQELMKLTIIDLISTILTVLIIDYIRSLVVRYMNICCCWDLERKFPEYGEFKIAENVLHLIYNQGVTWIGAFFCPLLPALNVIKLTILMYFRSWAVVTCNVPHTRVFRASGSNFYLVMLLFMLFLSLLPTMWVIVQCPPSNCGPFRNKERMHAVISETLENDIPDWMRSIIEYLSTPIVILPGVLLLFMIIYYLQAIARSARENNSQLKLQLHFERKDGKKNIFRMGAGKRENKLEKEASSTNLESYVKSENKQDSESLPKTPFTKSSFKLSIASTGSDEIFKEKVQSRRPRHSTPSRGTRATARKSHSRLIKESRGHRSYIQHTDDDDRSNTSCSSSRRRLSSDYHYSPCRSSRFPGCDHHLHSNYSPCHLHANNFQMRELAGSAHNLYSVPSSTHVAFATSLDPAGRPASLLLQPNHISKVPLILVPNPTTIPETHRQQQEKILYAQYDTVTGTVGNILQENASTFQSQTLGRSPVPMPRTCTAGSNSNNSQSSPPHLVRQSNVQYNTFKRRGNVNGSSCDTCDTMTTEGSEYKTDKCQHATEASPRESEISRRQ